MAEALKLAQDPVPLKLDLACGQTPRDGFEGVDFYAPNAKHKVDLWKFPLPWGDSSVEELHSSHFIEHLPAREVGFNDLRTVEKNGQAAVDPAGKAVEPYVQTGPILPDPGSFIGRDFLFAFMDECWRILKPNGVMTIIVPCARNDRAFQDPTHRRFIVAQTFLYFAAEWRQIQKLDHYRTNCDFAVNVVPIVPTELTLLHQEAQARRFNESWNTVIDWQATLIAKK